MAKATGVTLTRLLDALTIYSMLTKQEDLLIPIRGPGYRHGPQAL